MTELEEAKGSSNKQKHITQKVLLEILSYDENTGTFVWKAQKGKSIRIGSLAGYKNSDGYRYIKHGDKNYKAHRLAWLYVYGEWPSGEIDHINGIKDDNRISNLRSVSHRENQTNLIVHRNGKLPGACFDKRWNRWQASIMINGRKKHLGLYKTEREASDAYMKRAKELINAINRPCADRAEARCKELEAAILGLKIAGNSMHFLNNDITGKAWADACTRVDAITEQ